MQHSDDGGGFNAGVSVRAPLSFCYLSLSLSLSSFFSNSDEFRRDGARERQGWGEGRFGGAGVKKGVGLGGGGGGTYGHGNSSRRTKWKKEIAASVSLATAKL